MMRDFPDNIAMVLSVFIAGATLVFLGFFLHSCTIEKDRLNVKYKLEQLEKHNEIKKEVIEKLKVPPELLDQLNTYPQDL